jgi:hypothetical protein
MLIKSLATFGIDFPKLYLSTILRIIISKFESELSLSMFAGDIVAKFDGLDGRE